VQVKTALLDAEHRRVLAQPLAYASAADLELRAEAVQSGNPDSLAALTEARSLYDRALRLDPNSPGALMGRALATGNQLDLDPHVDHDRLVREYEEMSARVVAAAGHDARAWNIRADAL